MLPRERKPFPIPVLAWGPGSQPDAEPIDFLPMPREMNAYRAPALPEAQALAGREAALAVLHAALAALQRSAAGEGVELIELSHLASADRGLLNELLGEGEVAAQLTGEDGVQAQESVFAGLWRVVYRAAGVVWRDTLEVGAFPRAIAAAARDEGGPIAPLPADRPADTMNAPALLEELRERVRAWHPGDPPHTVNLTLLPLSAGDGALFERLLGRGRVLVLSRGYGDCRIASTRVAGVWRVSYFNAQDQLILDTLEVGAVPEVACAAMQDLEDSALRLAEVLQWLHDS